MKGASLAVGTFVGLALSGFASAGLEESSRFDTGTDGWTTAAVNPITGGIIAAGDPPTVVNGRLKAHEVSGGLFVLIAPSKFAGDKSAYYGGTARYLIADEIPQTGSNYSLILKGNGLAISHAAPAPTATLHSVVVPLMETGWVTRVGNTIVPVSQTQFQGVLAHLDAFAINGDYTADDGHGNDHLDRITLDNVYIDPVPEPAALGAFALGTVAVLRRRRRSRRGLVHF